MAKSNLVLGAGMTGLAIGSASGMEVYEAAASPGGICSSYYVRPGHNERLDAAPADDEAYRFEIGGGHWIFGGDPVILRFINAHAPVNSYSRRSSVYFSVDDLSVPYPLQNNLRFMDDALAGRALKEMTRITPNAPQRAPVTMADWLRRSFGDTLTEKFFEPFNRQYTAGLHTRIAPQDAYKSPVDRSAVLRGASGEAPTVGYNVSYIYPQQGLNTLAQNMARKMVSCGDVHYGKQVTSVDVRRRQVRFADGSGQGYRNLISTLPLNKMMLMTGLSVAAEPDPYTSVLVLNIGASKGPKCPTDHWLYVPDARSGFHRVGFYSNVDTSFLPASSRTSANRVSIYVERAYVGGKKPSKQAIQSYADAVVQELQQWQFIGAAEVVDPTWIDVAYTWSWPGSTWKHKALQRLEEAGIYQVGRYGRWLFQGIADSIRDGFVAGAAFKHETTR